MTGAAVRERLEKILSPGRYRHTLSVARWSRELARRHGADPAKAELAGLLHDCAKELPPRRLAAIGRRLSVPGKGFILETRAFGLFHAHVSARVARTRFGLRDRVALSAIAKHTLGAGAMGRLDKILYVADFSAPGRPFAAAARVRRLARRDLEAAFRETVRLKIQYVVEGGGPVHPQTVALWNGLCAKGKGK